MVVPFGFSTGDIAGAIKLIAQIVKALKETGGASSEFQEVLQYLKTLLLTLQHLQKLKTTCTDPSLVNAIHTLTSTAEEPINDIIRNIQKYEPALGSTSTRSARGKALRKIEWTLRRRAWIN